MYEADYLAEFAAKGNEGLSLPKWLLKRWWLVVLIVSVAFVLTK
ncbi:hypothetical protein GCM10027046_20840 [Uliginosibacterium flavum]|uniref:Uncharacterized protein n=1 Tax=Uliginosibacterium flavum TaxID=1396831 RepID=A0ABV2TRT4_9RHOO